MNASSFSARFLLATAVLALPLLEGGCGRTACFTWTEAEGQCPTRAEALPFFSSPSCPGHVLAVNSEATSDLDGQLCCYAVTERAHARGEANDTCGFGGESSVVAASSAFSTSDGSGGFGAQSSGMGGGFGEKCARCPEILDDFGGTVTPCDPSIDLFEALITCACFDVCGAACADNLCQSAAPSDACLACMQDSSTQGCGGAFTACKFDL